MERSRIGQNPAAPVDRLGGSRQQCLIFSLAGQIYGLDILAVREIIQYGGVSAIPMMPAFIRGVINLRGAVVPVLDLLARFHGTPAKPGRRSCIVVVELAEGDSVQDIGVLVDSVSAVLEIPESDIEPPPVFGAGIQSDFIAGMGKVNEDLVTLLHMERVLETMDLVRLADSTRSDGSTPSGLC